MKPETTQDSSDTAKAPIEVKAGPKRGLGRGLSALIPQAAAASGASTSVPAPIYEFRSAPAPETGEGLRNIPLRSISLNPFQPRKTFGKQEIEELTGSIREHGVLQPIVVRPTGSGSAEAYELIAGERRFRAASAAGLSSIPAVIREIDDRGSLAIALIENIQRENLNSIEAAQAYNQLLQSFNMTQLELASAVGKSQPQIANSLRLLNLPPEIQESLKIGDISEGHAKVILSLDTQDEMLDLCGQVMDNRLSVREAEKIAAEMKRTAKTPPRRVLVRLPDPQLAEISQKISLRLGTKVRLVAGKDGRGTIEIAYYDQDQLDGLLDKLGAID